MRTSTFGLPVKSEKNHTPLSEKGRVWGREWTRIRKENSVHAINRKSDAARDRYSWCSPNEVGPLGREWAIHSNPNMIGMALVHLSLSLTHLHSPDLATKRIFFKK